MLTVQNVMDAYERYKSDIDDVESSTFIEWVQFMIRFIYDKAKGIEPERFVKTQSYAVTTDPQTSALPTDFMDLNQTSCGLYLMDGTTPTKDKLGLTSYGSTDEGYYLNGSNIIFTGVDGNTYTMRYMPQPPTIDSLSDYLTLDGTNTTAQILEDRHLEYAVKAIDVLYEQWDDNAGAESVADFRFVRIMGDILESYKRTPSISVMKNFINNY